MIRGRRQDRIVTKAILPVVDLEAAVGFYESLGLEVERFDDAYAWVRHLDDEVLHLRLVPELDVATNAASAYLHVADVDAWYERWVAAGVAVDAPSDRPWGMRELELVDPSGNLIRAGHNR